MCAVSRSSYPKGTAVLAPRFGCAWRTESSCVYSDATDTDKLRMRCMRIAAKTIIARVRSALLAAAFAFSESRARTDPTE